MTPEELYKVFQGARKIESIGDNTLYSADGYAGLIHNGDGSVAYYKTEIGYRQTVDTLRYVDNYVKNNVK